MPVPHLLAAAALAPAVLMSCSALAIRLARRASDALAWRWLLASCAVALLGAAVALAWQWLHPRWLHGAPAAPLAGGLALWPLGAWVAVLVQFLGTVIGSFSSRYLQGEPGQRRYAAGLAGVLAGVQWLLLAGHWLVLIAAWAGVAAALHGLLCFYRERPFALLAAHKKRIADRLADLLLLGAAGLVWWQSGSGSLPALAQRLQHAPASAALQAGALLLALAVLLRTALLPVHGWLIQVMEAPTPVSALLHAGVVNLGGYVLIVFAPLLATSTAARWLLVVSGLASATLAGMVSLTRVSIKVRLAWSTVAQMGFMVLECGLGLYQLAALHLIGHSLYKAQAFLSAPGAVRESRLQALQEQPPVGLGSVLAAPWLAAAVLAAVQRACGGDAWPWWWTCLLALGWAPLLWLPARAAGRRVATASRAAAGLAWLLALAVAAQLMHRLALGVHDAPWPAAGALALAGMALAYLALAALRLRPCLLSAFRRWSYAGFYLDEAYTRVALRLWPASWVPVGSRRDPGAAARAVAWGAK